MKISRQRYYLFIMTCTESLPVAYSSVMSHESSLESLQAIFRVIYHNL